MKYFNEKSPYYRLPSVDADRIYSEEREKQRNGIQKSLQNATIHIKLGHVTPQSPSGDLDIYVEMTEKQIARRILELERLGGGVSDLFSFPEPVKRVVTEKRYKYYR